MGEVFVTATQLSVTGEERKKGTENVDARTCTLRDKVSSAHVFFSSSKRVSDRTSIWRPPIMCYYYY